MPEVIPKFFIEKKTLGLIGQVTSISKDEPYFDLYNDDTVHYVVYRQPLSGQKLLEFIRKDTAPRKSFFRAIQKEQLQWVQDENGLI